MGDGQPVYLLPVYKSMGQKKVYATIMTTPTQCFSQKGGGGVQHSQLLQVSKSWRVAYPIATERNTARSAMQSH